MRFTDGHSSSGVCSPSRYTLLTGRYHWRTRLQGGIVGVFDSPLIAPERMTIGTLAKQHGYRTAAIGKWHLGLDWPITPDQHKLLQKAPQKDKDDKAPIITEMHQAAWRDIFSKPIAGGPTTRGFDQYFGTDVPNWPHYKTWEGSFLCFIENDRTIGIPYEVLRAAKSKNDLASPAYIFRGQPLIECRLPTLGDRACAYIKDAALRPEPFLLYLPLPAPHTPLAVNQEWQGKSGLNPYADFVMETDAIVGRVLDALEKSGVADNTLVVFTSDNGCAHYIGKPDLEKMGHYPSGPLRGAKADAWEGGHRVPFIVRWPGRVKAGSVCDQLVQQSDLIATFAEVLGTKLPDNAGEDSVSLMPLLKGGDQPVRENAVSASAGGTPGIRSGSWKYIPAPGSHGSKGCDQSHPVQLYNLADDLGETRNLAAAMPEKVTEMTALLEKLITEGRSTPGAAQKNDVEVRRYPATPVKTAAKKKAP